MLNKSKQIEIQDDSGKQNQHRKQGEITVSQPLVSCMDVWAA